MNGIVTVVDNVGLDGTDRLRNIEILRFPNGDGTFTDVDGATPNSPATGTPVLSQPNPQQGEALSVSTTGFTDADNISPTNPSGAVTGPFSFQWQQRPRLARPGS